MPITRTVCRNDDRAVRRPLIIDLEANSLFAMANNVDALRLDDLAIFLAVLEGGGFRTAARRLGLSPSTVSDKIAQLEAQLGAPLLIRTTRSVMPTEAGRRLAERVSPLLTEARAALQDVADARHQVRGLLRLNVTGAVMVDMLPPLIDRFLTLHPHVRVEIVVEDRLVDITAAGCDAGIRYGESLARDMIAVPIGLPSQRLAYAAAPHYLAHKGTPLAPHTLIEHECIRLRFSSGALVEWEFERGDETLRIDPPGRLIIGVDAAAAAIALACSGRGVVATFENWLDPFLQSGALMPVLRDWWPQFEGPRLYFSSRLMTAPLRAFVDMVRDNTQSRQQASG
ncbi:LysR family transcriptional regulator [Xanthomonas prunicola]|uniref:LysR family transcriptional regulator n=1 Tax=Xanthomonas prunicola TaxID=2053930 RepID=UPI0021B27A44|nr:LysR family transcriptional regulator [Xanthomonas prunicola]UXA54203.1 LysR family transcriptional regulator [Xanthomonas prunicola]UXA68166.1 LysR family transcriptional regulator [Xanthomonas prunicola]